MKIVEASKEDMTDELQMLTGLSSRDITFMYYHVIKDGVFFQKSEEVKPIYNEGITVEDFDSWFDKL